MRETTTQLSTLSYTVTITEALLAGQTLLDLQGCTVKVNDASPVLPYLLRVGDVLKVQHTAGDDTLSGLELLAAPGVTTTAPGAVPDVDPAQWTYSDSFQRQFLGTDYGLAMSIGQATMITAGELTLGSSVAVVLTNGQLENQRNYARARLDASHWNSPDVQIQYDARFRVVQGGSTSFLPILGVRLVGANKTLEFDGVHLNWGSVLLGTSGLGMTAEVTARYRLTVDPSVGRIQVSQGQTGLIDVAIPADWAAGMGGQGLVELMHETSHNTTSGVGGGVNTQAYFDNFAVRSGNGSAQLGGGTSGGTVHTGSLWRFAEGPPDDALGQDGDVWVDTTIGGAYQRVGGAYQSAANLRGPVGPAGARGPAGAGSTRTVRLGTTTGVVLPGAYQVYGQGTRTYSDGIYPVYLRFDFSVDHPLEVEGFRFVVDLMEGGTLNSAYIRNSVGEAVTLGDIHVTTEVDGVLVSWDGGRNLAPGTYSLIMGFDTGTRFTVQRGQNLFGGATALVGMSTQFGNEVALGARFAFTRSEPNVVGSLGSFSMRVVTAPSSPLDDAQIWGDGAFEVVAAPGAAPYLRMRHEGNEYQLPLILIPPAGGGGGGEAM